MDLVFPKFAPSSLREPFPVWTETLNNFYWLFLPLLFLTLGNFCVDSKNEWCFFPGSPYFCRVLTCKIAEPEDENSQKPNLATIRNWSLSKNPARNTSTHYWYKDLPAKEKTAFSDIANCNQVVNMFRGLFSEKNVCLYYYF